MNIVILKFVKICGSVVGFGLVMSFEVCTEFEVHDEF